jgi:hypothetical protein
MLWAVFGSKAEEVAEDGRKLHNEELQNLYSSPEIIRMMKSGRMRWSGHVEKTGGKEKCVQICEISAVVRINNKLLSCMEMNGHQIFCVHSRPLLVPVLSQMNPVCL